MPDRAFNRLADNWRVLFAIAEIAGGDWPKRCADAFEKLTCREDLDAQGMGVMLLSDIQQIFAGTFPPPPEGESALPVERLFSRNLVTSLCKMTDRPWPEAQRGMPITESWLARHLRQFSVHSKTLRIGDDRAKGYERAAFADAFDRYLSGPGQSIRDSVTSEEKADFATVTRDPVVTDGKTPPTEGMSRCHVQSDLPGDSEPPCGADVQVIEEEALLL